MSPRNNSLNTVARRPALKETRTNRTILEPLVNGKQQQHATVSLPEREQCQGPCSTGLNTERTHDQVSAPCIRRHHHRRYDGVEGAGQPAGSNVCKGSFRAARRSHSQLTFQQQRTTPSSRTPRLRSREYANGFNDVTTLAEERSTASMAAHARPPAVAESQYPGSIHTQPGNGSLSGTSYRMPKHAGTEATGSLDQLSRTVTKRTPPLLHADAARQSPKNIRADVSRVEAVPGDTQQLFPSART